MKLILQNIKKSYDSKNYILKDANYEFENGKIYGLLGRNGAGKTTLFNCINNNIESEGQKYFLIDDKRQEIDVEDIGFSTAEPAVPEFLTGREFLDFFIEINKNRIKDLKTSEEYFKELMLKEEDLDKLLKDYSSGMKNKIQMLVNIISDSKLILLDEPLTSLDVVAQEEMKSILKSLKKDKILILSTHIMDLAMDLCDEIVILNNGVLTKVSEDDMNKEEIIEMLKDTDNKVTDEQHE